MTDHAAGPSAPPCPFCGSSRTELIASVGSSLLTSQHRCAGCRTYFESVRRKAPYSQGEPR